LGLNPRDVYEAKAQEMGVPFVDLSVYKPATEAINVVPEHVAKRHNVLPVRKDNTILYVAMADTNNLNAADDLRLVSRCTVRGVLAVPEHIEDSISRYYGGTSIEGVPGKPGTGMNPLKAGGNGSDDIVDTASKSS